MELQNVVNLFFWYCVFTAHYCNISHFDLLNSTISSESRDVNKATECKAKAKAEAKASKA